TGACRQSERTVLPDSLAAAHQETAGEVASGEIVVAGDRDERTLEPPGHVADEASLSAAGSRARPKRARGLGRRRERRRLGWLGARSCLRFDRSAGRASRGEVPQE